MSSDPALRAGAVLEIDLGGIVANWRLLAQRAAPALCAAVVKANGYGLGAVPGARALARHRRGFRGAPSGPGAERPWSDRSVANSPSPAPRETEGPTPSGAGR